MSDITDDANARLLLVLLGQLPGCPTTEKLACEWLHKKLQTGRDACVDCLMRLKRAGLITYEAGNVAVTEAGSRLAASLIPKEERAPSLELSDQQKVILQAVAERPLSVEELRLRCFRQLGRPHGSPKAVGKALGQLRERGLAEPAGHGPLLRWRATAKGQEQLNRLSVE